MKGCSIEGCEREFRARGLCHTHYVAARKAGMELVDRSNLHSLSDIDRESSQGTCAVCGPLTRVVGLGSQPTCANRARETRIAQWDADPERHKKYHREYKRRYKFGLPRGGIEELLERQGSACAICERALTINTARIDHDHSCCPSVGRTCGGCIRGVLCNACNSGLGMFRDDEALFNRAINYVKTARKLRLAPRDKSA